MASGDIQQGVLFLGGDGAYLADHIALFGKRMVASGQLIGPAEAGREQGQGEGEGEGGKAPV
ncbi:hypothetical protein GCM10008997_01650 [Halomonas salifodinae]